jgi:trimeric autotransporter adhesin
MTAKSTPKFHADSFTSQWAAGATTKASRRRLIAVLRMAHRTLGMSRRRLGLGTLGVGAIGAVVFGFGLSAAPPADAQTASGGTGVVTSGLCQQDATNDLACGAFAYATGSEAVGIGDGGASGANAIAIGAQSHANADDTVAAGFYSIANAFSSTALGDFSEAFGANATAVGNEAHAWNQSDVAIGDSANAGANGGSNSSDTAIGQAATATGGFAFAGGAGASATGANAISIGSHSHANADDTVAAGVYSIANAFSSTALGDFSEAFGAFATAVGNEAHAWNQSDVAIGDFANAGANGGSNSSDTAIGQAATATGGNGIALGAAAQSTGSSALAFGPSATASGAQSVAEGAGAMAQGLGGLASGLQTNAAGNGDIALGGGASTHVVIGAQTGGNIAIGAATGVVDGISVSGFQTIASGGNSIAIGTAAQAPNVNTVAIGPGADATNGYAVALGAGSQTAAPNATPNGVINGVTYTYAGGAPTSVLSIGVAGAERQITNVAAGRISATSTDAVNGSELYAADQAIAAGGVASTNSLGAAIAADLGGGSGFTAGGGLTAPSYTIGATTYNNVGSAFAGVNTALASLESGPAGLVQQTGGSPGAGQITIGAGTGGTSISVANSTAHTRTVTGVSAGGLTATSTDAVNGGQLFATNLATTAAQASATNAGAGVASVAGSLGGGAAYNPASGAYTAPSYTIGGHSYVTIGSALAAINLSIGGGGGIEYFHANSTLADSVASGANAVAIGDLAVASNSDAVALGAGSITAAAVATHDTLIGGIDYLFAGGAPTSTVSIGGPSFQRTLTNLAAGRIGATSTDAVNGSELFAAIQSINAVDALVAKLQHGQGNGQTAQALGSASATGAGSVATGQGGSALGTGSVAAGAVTATSTDAVNGSQLYSVATAGDATGASVATALGGGAAYTTGKGVSGPSYSVYGATQTSVGGAIAALQSSAPVQYSTSAAPTTPGATPSNDVTLVGANTSAPVALHNVAAGTAATDAVNVGQLQATQALNNAAFNGLQTQVNQNARIAIGGIATAAAMANIPNIEPGHRIGLGIGIGNYAGTTGFAVKLSARIADRLVIGASVGRADGQVTSGGGATLQW